MEIKEMNIPEWLMKINYNGKIIPNGKEYDLMKTGANCQVFAYYILRLNNRIVPDFRSSELWADVEYSELVKDKETGFLLKEHDVDGVVDALDWLLNHPIESEAIGQKAKALAFKRHDLKGTSAIKVSCYSEILSQGLNH